ncbi:MAG: 3-hydroxy-3-methylglutaryl CoA synthase [Deltaproteobacteria bacterium]|nr:3-hydroxy-3-methylglutaryl CoA synthase [Deltaproteobacteria bacterium]MBW2283241.1 3-hydroxy-3-methylglutaryl CoA synthase [Deltaproteobacteria bacterium]
MVGICTYGGYVPRYRLNRGLVYKAMGWMNPGNIANARGEKAVANYDEDSITMAVAAGIDALKGIAREDVDGVYFASTSMPYKERLNAGIVTAGLGLRDQIRAADFSGALKAGTTALLSALEGVASKGADNILVCVSDCRLGSPASPQELIFGDGAAAVLVGEQNVVAEFKGSFSTTHDFVDHFRGESAKFDRQWEDRWIRDLGFAQLVPEAVNGLLEKYQLNMSDFAKVVYPCQYAAARKNLNKVLAIPPEAVQDNLQNEIGETGTPQALLMLVKALEEAKPGDKILVVSFGSGCDALYFEATDNIADFGPRNAVSGSLANRAELDNYTKYLVWRDTLPADMGLRAEEDLWTRWSAVWRSRKMVLGLWGSKCQNCGTAQLPPQRICVNPECGHVDEMDPYRFSDKIGHINSYTGDMLAASYDPPAIYGAVTFEGGGKYYFDFTDCDLEGLATGMPVAMSFRKKYYDPKRDIAGYFWKAVPIEEVK